MFIIQLGAVAVLCVLAAVAIKGLQWLLDDIRTSYPSSQQLLDEEEARNGR